MRSSSIDLNSSISGSSPSGKLWFSFSENSWSCTLVIDRCDGRVRHFRVPLEGGASDVINMARGDSKAVICLVLGLTLSKELEISGMSSGRSGTGLEANSLRGLLEVVVLDVMVDASFVGLPETDGDVGVGNMDTVRVPLSGLTTVSRLSSVASSFFSFLRLALLIR